MRPHPEYCVQYKELMKTDQERTTNVIKSLEHLLYEKRLVELGLLSPEKTREDSEVSYQIVQIPGEMF